MDAKERREKIKQAIWQTLSESGTSKLSFPKINRGVDARIPKVHRYFLSDGFKEKEWDLELREILRELAGEDKIELSGADNWQLKIDERGIEIEGIEGGLSGD